MQIRYPALPALGVLTAFFLLVSPASAQYRPTPYQVQVYRQQLFLQQQRLVYQAQMHQQQMYLQQLQWQQRAMMQNFLPYGMPNSSSPAYRPNSPIWNMTAQLGELSRELQNETDPERRDRIQRAMDVLRDSIQRQLEMLERSIDLARP
jgi:hypothetical protein